MTNPVLNIYRTLNEALSVKNSQANRFYKHFGVQLLPNNTFPYIQVTNTPSGLHLEDWTVMAVSLCKGTQTDLTDYFMVERTTNSDNGDPQILWSLTNVPFDFGILPIYLKITQAVGETFYTQPFLLTNYGKEKTTQFHYKAKRTDAYQSVGFKSWFRQDEEKIELTTYYETSTQKTVTQAVKVNEIELHRTEQMSVNDLKQLTKVLRTPYLYADKIRCSLFDATELPKMTAEENFGRMDFSLSFKEDDRITLDVLIPEIPVISLLTATANTFNIQNTGATNLYVLTNDTLGTLPTTITNVNQALLTTGAVTIAVNGQYLIFTANGNIGTAQTFTYQITDATGATSQATVTLNVSVLAPSLTTTNDTVALVNTGIQNIFPLSNDTLGVLPTNITSINTSLITTGAIVISGNGQYLVFTPNGDYVNGETFTYTITDSTNATSTATVTLNVANQVLFNFYYEGIYASDNLAAPGIGSVTYIDEFNDTVMSDELYRGECRLIVAKSIVSTQYVQTCIQ